MKSFSMKSTLSSESEQESEKLTTTLFGCFSVNARNARYRHFYLCQMICFPFIPIFALFAQNLSIFIEQFNAYNDAREVNQQVHRCHDVIAWYKLINTCFQISLTVIFLSTNLIFHKLFKLMQVNVSNLLSAIQQERTSAVLFLLTNEKKSVFE